MHVVVRELVQLYVLPAYVQH